MKADDTNQTDRAAAKAAAFIQRMRSQPVGQQPTSADATQATIITINRPNRCTIVIGGSQVPTTKTR